MRLSANVPNYGDLPSQIGLGAMAQAAESAGADGVWLADHLLFLDEKMTGYPYAPDGVFPAPATLPFYESLASSAYLAAVTERCRIGIAVLVLPQRNVLELAKAAATVDRLSGGRFALGVGSGWNWLEMEALGYPAKVRGARMAEMLHVLHDCWSGSPDSYDGEHVSVRDRIKLLPTPAQPSGVPLLVGGMAPVSLRRAAEDGDGWLAISFFDQFDLDHLSKQVQHVCELRERAGGAPFELSLKLQWLSPSADPRPVDEYAEAVAAAAALGFHEVIVDLPWGEGVDRACDVLARCREKLPAASDAHR